MRATQNEFRREISSLKDSIHRLSIGEGNPPDQHSNTERQSRSNVTSGVYNPSSTSLVPNNMVKLKDWKISYDGTTPVSDTLCERTGCSHDHQLANFHVLLCGKAETFYWSFTQRNAETPTYPLLKYALTKEFGKLENDYDIILKISMRKQNAKESYDDFHSAIVSMNTRLKEPIAERSLIDIVKRNMNVNLKFMLFNSQPRTLDEVRDLARKGGEDFTRHQIRPFDIETS